ncbi:MAG: aspartate/glutamate racemase family protein, partial [Spirochaetota bacterium]|nr:aspartate/glutamate racemase family protein [Spirochaetota bacterium]
AVLSNCSSLGEIAVIVRQALTIPFIKIDEPMARKAVMIGKRIGIVATAHTTIGPSTRLFEETAAELGKEYSIRIFFAEGAYDALLIEKDREKHDRILMAAIDKACAESDAVCLAQGSMFSIAEQCYDKQVPVLHSFRTSVEYLTHVLDLE